MVVSSESEVGSDNPLLTKSEREAATFARNGGRRKKKERKKIARKNCVSTSSTCSAGSGNAEVLVRGGEKPGGAGGMELGHDRKRVLIRVTGMTCTSCVAKIERELAKKPGVCVCVCVCVCVYVCTMRPVLRYPFIFYPFWPKSKFSVFDQKPWTIIRRFDQNRGHYLWSFYSTVEGAMKLKFASFCSS